MRRREFLALGLALPALGYDTLLDNIKPPQFPDREFDITKFGAVEKNATRGFGRRSQLARLLAVDG